MDMVLVRPRSTFTLIEVFVLSKWVYTKMEIPAYTGIRREYTIGWERL